MSAEAILLAAILSFTISIAWILRDIRAELQRLNDKK